MKKTFKFYTFLTLISTSILLIFFINIIIFIIAERQMKEEKSRDYETTIKTVSYYIDRIIEEKDKDLNTVLGYLNSADNLENKKRQLKNFLSINPEIQYILIIDSKGIVKYIFPINDAIVGIDLSKHPVLNNLEKGKFYGPLVSVIDKKPYYVISRKLPDKFILFLIDIPEINSLVETLKIQGYYAFIVDQNGLAIAHVNDEIVKQGLNLSHYDFVKKGIKGTEEIIEADMDGKKYVLLARKIPQTEYTFFIGHEYYEALSSFYILRGKIIYIILLIIILSLPISLFISRRFTNPIKDIISMIENLKKGDYKISKTKSDIEELEKISEAIYEMAKTISDREIKLRKIFEASTDAIVISTFEGNILDFNDAAAKMAGFKDRNEVPPDLKTDLFYYNDVSDRNFILNKLAEKGYIENLEVTFKKRDGTLFYGLISSSLVKDEENRPFFIVSIIKDITDKRKLQEQLFQAQKMESIGRLAGSIAHDFNNILSIIHGSNQLIQMYTKNNPQIERYTLSITKGVEKARDFIKKLLAFSKRQPFIPKIYDLNEIIKEEIKLIKPTIREDITLELNTSDSPLLVNLDRTQFTQIILNLTVNAIDAMPDGGKIIISTEAKQFEYEHKKIYPFIREGSFACINFSDTGIGIPEQIKDKIFEPFFTTKPEGTGLGLTTVYGIVQQHNGFITVYSEEGKGTTFRIYLPLSISVEKSQEEHEDDSEISIRRILLVEDNEEVRTIVEEMLKIHGFEVYSFSNGLEALNKFKELSNIIDLCIFDVIMPSIGGFELYKKIKGIKPDIKVLFMTGYTDNLSQIQTIIKEGQQIINKPFSISELKKKIKEMS